MCSNSLSIVVYLSNVPETTWGKRQIDAEKKVIRIAHLSENERIIFSYKQLTCYFIIVKIKQIPSHKLSVGGDHFPVDSQVTGDLLLRLKPTLHSKSHDRPG